MFQPFFLEVRSRINNFIQQNCFWKKFTFVFLIYLFSFSSILQANYLYKTDISRATGLERPRFVNWQLSARFLNTILSRILDLSSYPRDISPALQIGSIFILSITSLLMVFILTKKLTYINSFLSVIVGISPYFLQNFCFVFDSFYFSLSIFLAVFPFLFYKQNKIFYILSGICLLGCYLSYQSAVSVYMMLALICIYMDYIEGKIPFKKICFKLLNTITVFLGCTLFCVALVHFVRTYFIDQFGTFCSLSTCYKTIKTNINGLINFFYNHWKNTPMGWWFLLTILCFFIFLIKQAIMSSRKQSVVFRLIFAIITGLLNFFFIVLWCLFFTQVEYAARVFIGTGIAFCIVLLSLRNEPYVWLRKIFLFISIFCVYFCITFSLWTGNLIDAQRRHEEFKLLSLSQDLVKFPTKEILFKGKKIRSPVVIQAKNRYPFVGEIVTPLQTSFHRTYHYFFGFYRPDLKRCGDNNRTMGKILLKNAHHKLTQINRACIEIELY